MVTKKKKEAKKIKKKKKAPEVRRKVRRKVKKKSKKISASKVNTKKNETPSMEERSNIGLIEQRVSISAYDHVDYGRGELIPDHTKLSRGGTLDRLYSSAVNARLPFIDALQRDKNKTIQELFVLKNIEAAADVNKDNPEFAFKVRSYMEARAGGKIKDRVEHSGFVEAPVKITTTELPDIEHAGIETLRALRDIMSQIADIPMKTVRKDEKGNIVDVTDAIEIKDAEVVS